MINYKIINQYGVELASVSGKNKYALVHALAYYEQYSEEGNVQLKADKKILIDYSEA